MVPAYALAYARENRPRFIEELKRFINFPSVSAQPKHASDLRRCAASLADHLSRIGLHNARMIATGHHPLVYADWLQNARGPTLLIYGHYDVQPPEPLNEWHSPPFSATVRGNNLYGRGASDDKGQMFAHVKSLEAYLRTCAALPVNVKCIFEGEEEIGSPNLHSFIERNRGSLSADIAVVSDMPIPGPNRPAITYAMRGGLSFELEVIGPKRDLHSGLYGGAVHNPLQALCEIVGTLHDHNGRVTIPGFYRRVREWKPLERKHMAKTGPSNIELLQNARATRAWGETGFTEYERTTIRPALTINGIAGGYQGPGTKGVIPARAVAKLSFRLVPDQDARELEARLREYIKDLTPQTVRSRLRVQSHAHPVVFDRNHPAMRAAAFAYRQGFGRAPIFLRCGGTIPVVDTFRQTLCIPTVLMGFALPNDNMHAPNEKFYLPNFYKGVTTCIWFLRALAASQRTRALPQLYEHVATEEMIASK